MAPNVSPTSFGRRQQLSDQNSSTAGQQSSNTSRYMAEFSALTNELASIRSKGAEAGQLTEPTRTDTGTTPQEKQILGDYNQADSANRMNEVLQTAQARNFWTAQEDGVKKDMTYVANQLGIDSNSAPPSPGTVKDIAPDNKVQQVQPQTETENGTSQLVANNKPNNSSKPFTGASDPPNNLQGSTQSNDSCAECGPTALPNETGGAVLGAQNANNQRIPGAEEESKDEKTNVLSRQNDPTLDQHTIRKYEQDKMLKQNGLQAV